MLELGPFAADLPDVLRLAVAPAFAWAAWHDVRTRRVTNRLWPPLVAVAVVALVLEGWDALDAGGVLWREFVLATGLSIGFLVPLAYGFWYFGGFGGADAKAIMVLALLFPTVPTYEVAGWLLPVIEPEAGVFSLSILTNAVLIGLVYPVALAARNARSGDVGWILFIGRRVPVEHAVGVPGRLLETAAGTTWRGLDLDALRMYLRWRGCTLEELRADPAHFRETAPTDPGEPGDGAVADGGTLPDPWAAEAFLDDVEGDAYGTTPELLRDSLEVLVDRDAVWYSPGIPFILLIAAGLAVALAYGDLFLVVLRSVGLS